MANRWASPQRVVSLIDGRWTLAVLAELQDGGRRYQELDDVEAQQHFVANASHELRTPLAGLETLLEVTLGDPDADTATLQAACQEALTLSQYQQRLVQALLTLATSERGIEVWEPFDLATITNTVLTGRGQQAERRDLRVDTTFVSAPATGDPKLVEVLVANLIENAIHHNKPGGRIEVSTISAPGRATITVSNAGPTIAPSDIDRLFQPFQRAGTQRVGQTDGLAIVQAIAHGHHAELTALPRPEGGLDIAVTFEASGR